MLLTPNTLGGVLILLAKSLPAEILLVKSNPVGRFIILTLRIVSTVFTLVNIYVPPPFSPDVLSHLSLLLLSRSPGPLLFVGDFNAVLDPAVDRLRGGGRPYPTFIDWTQVFALTKLWRWKHLGDRQFSSHSDSFHTMSRIDLAFAPVDVLPLVHSISYLPRGISDHAPLLVGLLLLPRSGFRVWRLNPHWLKDEIVQVECQRSVTEYWSMNQGTTGLTTAWDVSKAVLRGTFMSITGIMRKNAQQCTEELESALMKAEAEYSQNPNALSLWLHCRREYELRLLDLTKKTYALCHPEDI